MPHVLLMHGSQVYMYSILLSFSSGLGLILTFECCEAVVLCVDLVMK
jgi:hypothetical protein